MKHSHPLVAALYDPIVEAAERGFLGSLRSQIAGAASGRVVEVGAGTGRNFPHYRSPDVAEVLAIEPDPHMRRRAETRVAKAAVPIRLIDGLAEALPVADAWADTIVVTLVLCSVDEPERAIREWRRVLRPGGSVLLIEHIRAAGPLRARLQDWITPLWRRIAAGCHPNRATLDWIRQNGFEFRETDRVAAGPPWVQPVVAGMARPS